ncbi:MAG TPA: ribonuclease III, partial [Leptospiraceae bacterium]|nr:ribonuclease III [Leptospiraceae bacterium]
MRKKNSSFHFQSEILNNPLLILACTHKSYSNENSTPNESNERLEFIGDTVLGLIASEFLYKEYPSEQEGKLSKLKSVLVSESSLATIAKRISLNKYLLLGKGERLTGGTEKESNLANLTEAVLGAIFLEYGLDKARDWILPELKNILRHSESTQNPSGEKSVLQELLQKK